MTGVRSGGWGRRAAIGLLSLLMAGAAGYAVLLGMLPPTARDALIHHLAVPKLWLQAGRIIEIPWADFSYYPMNVELLYLIPLALGADWAAHLIHLGFGLLTAGLIFLFVRERQGTVWGLAGALLFFSTPAVLRLSVAAYVDLGLAFFMTLAVFALVYWAETGRSAWFVLSGVALGLALGTKYNGLIGAPFLALGVVGIRARHGSLIRAVAWAAAYGVLALIVFAPWAVKNYLWTGNPIYPLFNGLFGLPGAFPEGQSLSLFTIRAELYGETFWQILTVPVRAFFQGRDYSPRFFDGVLNPLLILLPLPALLKPRRPETGPLAFLAAAWILAVFFQASFIARYIALSLPLLAVLGASGLARIAGGEGSGAGRKTVAALILAAGLGLNAWWAVGFWQDMDPGPYLTGKESRSQYLARRLDFYPALQFINKSTPPDARVLFLFSGSRGYYCDRDYFYQTWFSGEILRPVMEKALSGEDVRAGLAGLGATHVLARDKLLADYVRGLWPAEWQKLWADFTARGWERIYGRRGYSVYRLIGEEGGGHAGSSRR